MSAIELDYDIDLFHDRIQDLPAWLAERRAEKPYAWVKFLGRPALLLISYELIEAAFRDEETFPAGAHYAQEKYLSVLGHTIQTMDGAEHRQMRGLVAPAFRPTRIRQQVEALLEPLAHDMLDEMESRGAETYDLVAELTRLYPVKVITAMLGLPLIDAETLSRWAVGLLSQADGPYARQSAAEFAEYVGAAVTERRRNPGTDLLSELATTEIDGRRLTDQEIFSFVAILFPAGADTTYLNLGSALAALLSNPDEWAKVVADPAEQSPWAANEALRWYSATSYLPRTNPHDTTWQGIHIPADTPLLFALLGAGRDEGVYPDADRFDIDRRALSMLTFGLGSHFCLGAHLARAEITTVVRVLAERYPKLRLDPTRPPSIQGSFVEALRGPDAVWVYLR